jgi:hypothetical protein
MSAAQKKNRKKQQQAVDDDEYMVVNDNENAGSKVNGVKGNDNVALDDAEDELSASLEGISIGGNKKEKKKTKGVAAEVESNVGKKGGKGKKGKKNAVDDDDDDLEFGINGSVSVEDSVNGDGKEDDEMLNFTGKKKGKGKGKKGKESQIDDFDISSQTSGLESLADKGVEDDDESLVFAGKKRGKGGKGKKVKDDVDDYDIPLSSVTSDVSAGLGDEAEDEDADVFKGKKKGKGKNKKGNKLEVDDFEAILEMAAATEEDSVAVPAVVVKGNEEDDEDANLFTGKKKGKGKNKKGGKAQIDDYDMVLDEPEVQLPSGNGAEMNEDEVSAAAGNKKGKGKTKGKKGIHMLLDDDEDFEAVLAGDTHDEPEVAAAAVPQNDIDDEDEELMFTGKKKKKGTTKKAPAIVLDEDLGDKSGLSVEVPQVTEAEREEPEDDDALMFAGKKKGKKGKKDKKPVKEEEDIDALMAELEGPNSSKDIPQTAGMSLHHQVQCKNRQILAKFGLQRGSIRHSSVYNLLMRSIFFRCVLNVYVMLCLHSTMGWEMF